MISSIISEIAERACKAENLAWSLLRVSPNQAKAGEWKIYYDAKGRKSHTILIRLSTRADSNNESLEAEVRGYLRDLKESGRL